MQILLSRTQAGPGRTVKQEQEDISRNHVQTFSGCSVHEYSNPRLKATWISIPTVQIVYVSDHDTHDLSNDSVTFPIKLCTVECRLYSILMNLQAG